MTTCTGKRVMCQKSLGNILKPRILKNIVRIIEIAIYIRKKTFLEILDTHRGSIASRNVDLHVKGVIPIQNHVIIPSGEMFINT